MKSSQTKIKKIIHIDMDCFFAAIEIRDNPGLKNKPVAVGGKLGARGVLSTCNYEARKYGLHSAMPVSHAVKLCPKLVLLSVNMAKYKAASKVLFRIFKQYTPLVEMISLDEAFLDVTNCKYCKGSATLIAKTIKKRIKKELNLTASAGVASNKFLAKVASDWRKPDGLFVITPEKVDAFVKELPVAKIYGVGKVTAKKLHSMRIRNCFDMQKVSLTELRDRFGKMGERFYYLCRGIDDREVKLESVRKSLSIEKTFPKDLQTINEGLLALRPLVQKLERELLRHSGLKVKKQFVKIKFHNFKVTTVESVVESISEQKFLDLFQIGYNRYKIPVRLLGVGVKFEEGGS